MRHVPTGCRLKNIPLDRMRIPLNIKEPLLRPDFFDILGYAHKTGYTWGMTSNATLITPSVARRLYETGMATISVSIDGLEKTHDLLRGLSGGYRLAMTGIENLLSEREKHRSEKGRKKPFRAIQVTTVINHENIHELDRLYRIFEGMDIDSWRVIGLEPIGRALLRPELMLTPDDQRRLFSFIYEKRCEQMPVAYGCSHFVGFDYEHEVRDWYFLPGYIQQASWPTETSEPALILRGIRIRSRGIFFRHPSRRSGTGVLKSLDSLFRGCVRTVKTALMTDIAPEEPITVSTMKITGRGSA